MPNPFNRPRAVFVLEVRGTSGIYTWSCLFTLGPAYAVHLLTIWMSHTCRS